MLPDGDGSGGGGGGGGGAPQVIAYYINREVRETIRAREFVEELLAAGHQVHMVVGTPDFVCTNERMQIREVDQLVLECGSPNALTLDQFSSLDEYYDTYVVPRESILREEAEWMRKIKPNYVMWSVSDYECCSNENGRRREPLADTVTPLKSLSSLVSNGLSPKTQRKEKDTLSQLRECKVVHSCEKTPSPPSKRQRGRSVPPVQGENSHLGLPAARRRSSSSPPSPGRGAGQDETMVVTSSSSPTSPDRTRTHDERMAIPKPILNPMTVFWDIENCQIPKGIQVEKVLENVRRALLMNFSVDSVTINAYGASDSRVKEGFQRGGVKHVDVENKKDAADKFILVDMLLYAYDSPKGSSILLISGDGDFTRAVQGLVQRGHTIVVAIPSVDSAAAALINAGSYVWDWPSFARGSIIVPTSLPDNIDVVKAKMVSLFASQDGFIELVRILPEYQKAFGKQIRLANYEAAKLIDLFLMMGSPFVVMEKMVFLDQPQDLDTISTGTAEVDIAVDLFVKMEDDDYGPMKAECAEHENVNEEPDF